MTPESVQAMIEHASSGENSVNSNMRLKPPFPRRDKLKECGSKLHALVKFATCTLLGAALTWWNSQIRTLGPDAYSMTWEVLKKNNDILSLIRTNPDMYRSFVANETKKVDKYISRLPDNIYGHVKSARPKTLDETIELANDLMDQKLRTYEERQTDNKRKADGFIPETNQK
ncbi:hypothetical protein Tco_1430627 [Tanacetum coccineum]